MGKIIAGLILLGGIMIIRALLTPSPNTVLIVIGSFLFIVAFVLFFKELKNL